MSRHQHVPLTHPCHPRPNGVRARPIGTKFFESLNLLIRLKSLCGRPSPTPKKDVKYFGTTRVAVSTVMVRITRSGTEPIPLSLLVAVSTPNLANWAIMVKPTAVGNAACCRTVILTALAAKTHTRCRLHTIERTPRVATTTTVVTKVGTPTLTSLTMVPRNNSNMATQEALKVVAQRPMRLRPPSLSNACPPHLPPVPTHQVCATAPIRPGTPTDANRGLSAPTDYRTAAYWNFPSRW